MTSSTAASVPTVAPDDLRSLDQKLAVLRSAYLEHSATAPGRLLEPAWAVLSPLALSQEPPHAPRALFAAAELLADVLTRDCPGTARAARAQELRTHVRYVAEQAGVTAERLLVDDNVPVDPPVLSDALFNIAQVAAEIARLSPEREAIDAGSALPEPVAGMIERAEARLQGWCSRQKAEFLAHAILTHRPEICVEIGIYGGRSIVPCAAALRQNGSGKIWGIESWSRDTALEFSTSATNDVWWAQLDYNKIKREFLTFLVEEGLSDQIGIVEAASARAAHLFDRIDFLHIDGGHSVYGAAEDVVLYARKVAPGGLVIFDDVEWPTTEAGYKVLEAICDPVASFENEHGQVSCVAFRKR